MILLDESKALALCPCCDGETTFTRGETVVHIGGPCPFDGHYENSEAWMKRVRDTLDSRKRAYATVPEAVDGLVEAAEALLVFRHEGETEEGIERNVWATVPVKEISALRAALAKLEATTSDNAGKARSTEHPTHAGALPLGD